MAILTLLTVVQFFKGDGESIPEMKTSNWRRT